MHLQSSSIQTPQVIVGTASDDVMRQFQQLMSQFLQTQAVVMSAYLQGAAPGGMAALGAIGVPAPAAIAAASSQPIRYVTPEPVAAPPMPSAVAVPARYDAATVTATPQPAAAAAVATLRVEPAPAPIAPPAATAATAQASPADVLSLLLNIVSERTGYPQEMLEVEANIEADLGIDSIKRIEILTAFQQMHAGAQRGAYQAAMEKLAAVKTLRETASLLADLLTGQAEPAVV